MRLHANARKTSTRTSPNVKVETTYIAPSSYAPPHNTVRDTIAPREEFRGRVEPLRHVSNATLELFVRTKYMCASDSHMPSKYHRRGAAFSVRYILCRALSSGICALHVSAANFVCRLCGATGRSTARKDQHIGSV